MTGPDFEALRAERNRRREEWAAEMRAEGWNVSSCDHPDDCYCNCPEGPCEHNWDGPVWESVDGLASSVTCSRCGTTAMSHSLRTGP